MRQVASKIASYILGMALISFGVVMIIRADVGAAPWDALNVGLQQQIGLTIGSWVFIVGFILILIAAAVKRTYPQLLNFIPVVLVGSLIDFFNGYVLTSLNPVQPFAKYGAFLGGLLVLAMGIAIYLNTKVPIRTPHDDLTLALNKKLNWSVGAAKTLTEILGLVLALLAKGPISFGTLISVALLGPLINMFIFLLFHRTRNSGDAS
ncbi:YitT family protein [Paenibacillus sp. FJAT-26967]|uniref:YczE/YyaS/YitT family protein n=1 Tax=Paenibacillus sp. FJAT-26967 TaxID=1729690 RepID=UPI0008397285|nr:hypothetical protein [Paenibacillus sp. FJAT-26967]